jgi:hypothetical protein
MILSPVMNVFSQLHIDCVSYHCGDYAQKDLSTALMLFIMSKSSKKPFWDTNTAAMISSDSVDENWEDWKVRKFGSLRRPGSFGR